MENLKKTGENIMNRREIGMIIQGAGVIGVVAGAILVATVQPYVAGLIVGGVIAVIVGRVIGKGVKK